MAVPTIELSGAALAGVEALAPDVQKALPTRVRLGCILRQAEPPVLQLSKYFTAGATPPPQTNYRAKAAQSLARMYMNDQMGCCCPPGTLVRTGDGSTCPIEQVRVTQEVQTAEGNTGPVSKVMARYINEPLLRVVAWGHSHLRLTREHPILTRRGYVPAGELKETDWIALPATAAGNRLEVPTSRLLEGIEFPVRGNAAARGYAASVAAQRKATAAALDRLPRSLKLTPALGRLIGLFLAEGSTSRRIISFTFSQDERDSLVQETVDLLRSELLANPVLSERPHAIEVRVCGTMLYWLFRRMGGVGAAGKKLHPSFFAGPPDFLRAVFDGWMDGDGHARRNERVGTSVSHELALDMFNIAQTLGFEPVITTREPGICRAPNGPGGALQIVNARRSWSVTVTDKRKASRVSKAKRSGYWLAWGSTEDGRNKNLGTYSTREAAEAVAWAHEEARFGLGRVKSEGSTTWRRIRRIEQEPYSGYVYNLEVIGDNSYIAEGVGVHNCVVSGKMHSLGLWSSNDPDSGGIILATDKEVVDQYRSICGPADRGCIITNVLDIMRSRGLTANGKPYTIDGYVAVNPTDQLLTQTAQYLFGASTIGISLPKAWTQESLWDITSSPIVGGHDVSALDWDNEGVFISSWGRIYKMTWRAWQSRKYIREYYSMLAPSWYNADRMAACGVDAVQLRADLAKLGRGIIPDVEEPEPPPEPPDSGSARLEVPEAIPPGVYTLVPQTETP